jgi:SAM-dependent methyltransferase
MNAANFIERSCPVCGSSRWEIEVASNRRAETLGFEELRRHWATFSDEKIFFSYARCKQCEVLFTPVFFSEPQLELLYGDLPPNMGTAGDDSIDATQRGYFDAVMDESLSGGYLEIGPDVGHIARHAAKSGKFNHFWLYEPNEAVHPQLAASANPYPVHVSPDMADLSAVPDGSVGLAVMVHVLDHLIDPGALLKQIHAKLRPGGRLMIVTHNEKTVLRSLLGKRFPPFCLQHPELYNPESIGRLLTEHKFDGVKVRRSVNHFPIPFLAKYAAQTLGFKVDKVPLPNVSIGLKLGNILTVAQR